MAYELLGTVMEVEREGNVINITCENAPLRLYILGPRLVRVRLAPFGFSVDHSWAVVKEDWPETNFSIEEDEETLEIHTRELKVVVRKKPCRIAFYDRNGRLINSDYKPLGMGWNVNCVKCWKLMPRDEHYYGFGEKALPLDRRRRRMEMWNTDAYGYRTGTDPLYVSVPFFIAIRKGIAYGIFFDNTYRSIFDMGSSSEDYYSFEAEGGELNYYFIYGPSIKDVIDRYTELTGRPFLPPLWALGHQQCRYSYYPAENVLELAKRYREKDIPCDVIYLDIDYMDSYKIFTWSNVRFPDPKKLTDELGRMGFKLVTIIDPGVKAESGYKPFIEGVKGGYFCRRPNGEIFFGRLWPGTCAFPDFAREDVRDWWASLHEILFREGVSGIWNDMNEPALLGEQRTIERDVIHIEDGKEVTHAKIHNVYALLEAMGTFKAFRKFRKNMRHFILSRSGYAGIQRYAAVWTGDNTSNWEHLWLQIPMLLGMGLSGMPFVGADVGGFIGSPTPELLVRWYQLAAFIPLCRNHTSRGTFDQEPWVYGEYYESIIRRYLKLRYRLLPYLYTLFKEASEKGYPIMRPLLFEYQDDPNTYTIDDEFLIGENLLIAPVLKEGCDKRLVYLPKGTWVDYWTHKVYKGPTYVSIEAPLDKMPIFVKNGSIIPMQPEMNYVGERDPDPLTLDVYLLSGEASFTLYEDDGVTLDYVKGIYYEREFRCRRTEDVIELEASETRGKYVPSRKSLVFKVNLVSSKPKGVLLNNKILKAVSSLGDLKEGWHYDPNRNILHVAVPEEKKGFLVRIKLH